MTEASAKTFRLAKQNGSDPFNWTSIDRTRTYLEEVIKDNGSTIDLIEGAGRYPGSWTLPVCDTSTWGEKWNWDYTSDDYKTADRNPAAYVSANFKNSKIQTTHPPCMCGEFPVATQLAIIWLPLNGRYDSLHFNRTKSA